LLAVITFLATQDYFKRGVLSYYVQTRVGSSGDVSVASRHFATMRMVVFVSSHSKANSVASEVLNLDYDACHLEP
jgi:hypothetical protein